MTRGKRAERTKHDFHVLNLPLCHWSSQLFDLRAPSSTDAPVLLLNQPNNAPHQEISCRRKLYGGKCMFVVLITKTSVVALFHSRRSICLAVHCDA